MSDGPRDPQLLKGVLPLLILALLTEQESYGYELVGRLTDAGLTGIATGSVYPVLSRLERDRLISSRLVASPAGPARKYYRPTPAGASELLRTSAEWWTLVTAVRNALSTTPAASPGEPQECRCPGP